jgi:hypothetical protein
MGFRIISDYTNAHKYLLITQIFEIRFVNVLVCGVHKHNLSEHFSM